MTMLTYGYLAYQAERPKSRAEQREADAQLGQLFAAIAQLLCLLAKPVRALRRQSVPKGRQCSPELGSAPGDPEACGAQRRPLAVG
jgi:hypothetical protein